MQNYFCKILMYNSILYIYLHRIDFDDSSKPTNLANSAVLRMLEEEEFEKRHGHQSGKLLRKLLWFLTI